jgi:DegV family protein with EDD domain
LEIFSLKLRKYPWNFKKKFMESEMSEIAIITDSTAYLPENLVAEYGIHVLPLKVIWGEESLDDNVDITPAEFYNRLSQSQDMPTTSQVTVGEFKTLFEKLHAEGKEILTIVLSSGISGTLDSAEMAKVEVPDAKIALVDSKTTIGAMAFIVLAAARAACDGASLEECVAVIEEAKANSGVVFAVDTLEFLHRGGRIGGARKLLGTVLNIKPILTLNDGKVDSLEQARTRGKSLNRLVEIVAERVRGKSNLRLGVSHANVPQDAEKMLETVSARLNPDEVMISELSPVIGTHTGPGTIALAYFYED